MTATRADGSRRTIMLVAGEASGDLHAATLARSLRALAPDVTLVGMGGMRMAEVGVDLVDDVTGHAVVGGTEAVGRVPRLWHAYRRLTATLASRQPAALVLIDFPEFNLRLARAARRASVPVVYFIPPQVWAWRPRRVETIRRLVSLVLAVFPFELALYRGAQVPVEFVGHPVLDALTAAPSRAEARRLLGVEDDGIVVGLLPGSRKEEVARVLPLMREAAGRLVAARPGTRFVLGLAPTIPRSAIDGAGTGPPIEIVPDRAHAVMRAADVLLVASGTATLEAGLLGTPMVVCYRVSRATEAMARLLVRVPWISLVNLVLGREVVPELYQAQATGERLAAETARLLGDPGALASQRAGFAELAHTLGQPGVGMRAARSVLAVAMSGSPQRRVGSADLAPPAARTPIP